MDGMMATCGLDCATCQIHLATIEQDQTRQQAMRVEIARLCSQQYNMKLLPGEVTDCDGCSSQTGRLFSGCAKCEIRKCAIDRRVTSCAFCAGYPCERLVKHFESDPVAQTRLEALRGAM